MTECIHIPLKAKHPRRLIDMVFQDVELKSHDENKTPLGLFTIVEYFIGQTPWYILKLSECPEMFSSTTSIPGLTKEDLKKVRDAIDKMLKE